MHKQLPRAKGFTLVELLVVIAIIALIIGILLPSIASARAQSKFVACGVNLRTIGQMVHAYAGENEDRGNAGHRPAPGTQWSRSDSWRCHGRR